MAGSNGDIQRREAETQVKGERIRQGRIYSPNVDIIERKDHIVIIVDIPGVDDKSVDITLEKNVLSIYGKVDADIPENHRLYLSEYGIGDYQRVFTLSDEVDRERIQATVNNGVLKLILPKAEIPKTKKIPVKTDVI